MADVMRLGNALQRGVTNWASSAVKKGLDEITGTEARPRGRPREWIKIPSAVIEGHPLEPYFLAAAQGIRPPAVVPTTEEGLSDVRLAQLPQPSAQKNSFLSNINWTPILILAGIGLLFWLISSSMRQPVLQSAPLGGYGCVIDSYGDRYCGRMV